MALERYSKKRDFKKTREPRGVQGKTPGAPIFVVQKHRARQLHYDFRLEVDEVLVSWAVPKGPPEIAAEKRLAVMVEDHPLEYAKFEGKIPEGEYGAGTVEIWDKGTYKNLKDAEMATAVKNGQIEIELKGKKMKGSYALVRTKLGVSKSSSAKAPDGRGRNWLLIKMKKS